MTRHRARMLRFAVGGAAILVALAGGNVAAGGGPTGLPWTETTLRTLAGIRLQDADFDGNRIAVAWTEPGPGLYARTSINNGDDFAARELVASNSRMAELDVCGSDVYVAYARLYPNKVNPDRWLIDMAERPVGSPGFADHAVSFGDRTGRDPDVTCAGPGRVFVSWLQGVEDGWRVKLNHARRADGDFAISPIAVGSGPANRGEPVVAGVSDHAYVAWTAHDGIRFRRWTVGGGPGYPVAPQDGVRLVEHGEFGMSHPFIAARQDKVVVAWHDCGSIRARVSNDRGDTWGPRRTVFQGACGSEFGGGLGSIQIAGTHIFAAVGVFSEDMSEVRMIRTGNDFATRMGSRIYEGVQGFILGARPSGMEFALRAAIQDGSQIRFLTGPGA